MGFEKVSKTKFLETVKKKSYSEYMCLCISNQQSYTFIFNDYSEFSDVSISIRDNNVYVNNHNEIFKRDFNDKNKYNEWIENISSLYVAKNSNIIKNSIKSFIDENA